MQEEVFHEVADEFITLANQLSDDWATPMFGAAFMYAAARYNAFLALDNTGSAEERRRALDYLTDQFRRMVQENLGELA